MSQKNKPETGRFRELDGIRGIAATAVVLMHLSFLYEQLVPHAEKLPIVFPYGGYGVELFFLVSGFVILMTVRRSRTPQDFLISRLTRLYPTYWVAVLITSAVVNISHVDFLRRSPVEILANLTMIQQFLRFRHVDGAYWSLSMELVFYALMLLALIRARVVTDRVVGVISVAWVSVSILLSLADRLTDNSIVHNLTMAAAAPFSGLFVTGMYCFISRERRKLLWQTFGAGLAACILAAINESWLDALIYGALIAFFVAVTQAPNVPWLTWRPILWLGSTSYPLYLVHQSIGYAIEFRLTPLIGRPAAFAVALGTALALGTLLHKVVEVRISRSLRRWLTARFGSSKPAAPAVT